MPQGNELEALWDRFLLRFRVGYVTDTGFAKFIRAASAKLGANHNGYNSNGSQPPTLLQSELAALQKSAAQVAIPNAVIDLIRIEFDLYFSDSFVLNPGFSANGGSISDRMYSTVGYSPQLSISIMIRRTSAFMASIFLALHSLMYSVWRDEMRIPD
jgi:hypothetical protein